MKTTNTLHITHGIINSNRQEQQVYNRREHAKRIHNYYLTKYINIYYTSISHKNVENVSVIKYKKTRIIFNIINTMLSYIYFRIRFAFICDLKCFTEFANLVFLSITFQFLGPADLIVLVANIVLV
jgi:hypothetical protein